MIPDLDTLRNDVLEYLTRQGFVVYYGAAHHLSGVIHWNIQAKPDFRDFLKVAAACGVKMVVFYAEQFERQSADDALEDLGTIDLDEDDFRSYGRRLRELREYDGFTCVLELAFTLDGVTYLYHVHTDWFDEYLKIRNQIDEAFQEDEEGPEEDMGGYFSKN
jgi:hypothetical protein